MNADDIALLSGDQLRMRGSGLDDSAGRHGAGR
jgi:hypothetical protein